METLELFAQEPSSDQMFCAEDSPARTLATQASGQGSTANGQDYGQSTPELLASYDPATSSWRTSQLCLDGDLSEFSETWPRSGLMRNGIAYRLPPLVPLTAGTDSGLLPTPRADERGQGMGAALAYAEAGFKQPTTRNGKTRGKSTYDTTLTTAVFAVRLWPTPSASDDRDRGNLSTPAIARRASKGKQLMLSMVVDKNSGALNPTWVEWLMGFPLGWTALDAWATPLSRKSRKSSAGPS